ncbi:MAG: DUF4982 domain-containing protein [Bacteroidales bacterium]|nr:DUF4982 domain-containing protein [Candidatus Sodaliphilus aphodohippi]
MKHLLTIALLAATALGSTAQPTRDIYLSDNWQFSRDMKSWQTVTVPHDWAIAGPFDVKHDRQKEVGNNSEKIRTGRTGSLPWIGEGTYRRTFTVDRQCGHAELIFDGAMADAHVYVNGKLAGHWPYGYNAFRIDVTPYLNTDGSENALEVRLNNKPLSSRWYPGAGIYRPVKLHMTREAASLDTWGAYITTEKVKDGEAIISVRHKMVEGKKGTAYSLAIKVLDNKGNIVATGSSTADGVGDFHDVVTVTSPNLWSPETPNLYKAVFTLSDGNTDIDRQEVKFGIRTISFTKENGFMLNGKRREFKGVCMHHDLGPLGTAVNKTALIRQIKKLKEMGANAIRTSHNMPSTMQMELCDSLGMMVMAESFDAWKDVKVKNGYNLLWDEWWSKDVTNLVLNHRNHPCIVMWSASNEISEQWHSQGATMMKNIAQLFHRLDPTRPVTGGMNSPEAALESGFAYYNDVPGLNYNLGSYDTTYTYLPHGFLLGSETASTVSSRGEYMFPDNEGPHIYHEGSQCSGYDTEYCWWSNLPDDDWKMQEDRDWTIGEFVWTGYDYLGEPTPYDEIGYWPSRSSYFGIIDLAGLPKDRYYLYRSHWNTDEHTLHVLPHWTWPGREGKVTPVYCYTDYPSAELFVNGKSQGRITKNDSTRLDRFRLRWREVKYEPGEIRVVAYDKDGNKAGEKVVKTAGRPARLLLEPERTVIDADGNDLAYVTVSLVDKNGTLCPDAADQLEFTVKGCGQFKAVCNGDATSLESFVSPTMKLFHGQLVVVLQSSTKACTMTLNVKDKKNGIKASVKIETK